MDTKLNGKAASNHTHSYAATSHTHDDRYYTESEMNTKLSGKSDTHSHPYLNTANVANNVTTTSSGYALDARQGKTLNDRINDLLYRLAFNASMNGTINDALLVNLTNKGGDENKPWLITASSKNIPNNLAWGVREVFWMSANQVVVRISGIENDGAANIWTISYNYGSWTGWGSILGSQFFYPGDSYTIFQSVMPATITGNASDLMFTIHLPKMLKNIGSFVMTDFSFIFRADGPTVKTMQNWDGISADFLWQNYRNSITIIIHMGSAVTRNNVACSLQIEKATINFYG